jgi:hypothetical protein
LYEPARSVTGTRLWLLSARFGAPRSFSRLLANRL